MIVTLEQALPIKPFGRDVKVLLTTEATGGAEPCYNLMARHTSARRSSCTPTLRRLHADRSGRDDRSTQGSSFAADRRRLPCRRGALNALNRVFSGSPAGADHAGRADGTAPRQPSSRSR